MSGLQRALCSRLGIEFCGEDSGTELSEDNSRLFMPVWSVEDLDAGSG